MTEVLSHSWIGKINILKMVTVPKAVHRFSAIPIKISVQFLTGKTKTKTKTKPARYIINQTHNLYHFNNH